MRIFIAAVISVTFLPVFLFAADKSSEEVKAEVEVQRFIEDTDGNLVAGEYEVISVDASLTRAPCPYSCENRGLARSHCREWRSTDGSKCYVHDTRGVQGAVRLEK